MINEINLFLINLVKPDRFFAVNQVNESSAQKTRKNRT
jgi:hypothetical protein